MDTPSTPVRPTAEPQRLIITGTRNGNTHIPIEFHIDPNPEFEYGAGVPKPSVASETSTPPLRFILNRNRRGSASAFVALDFDLEAEGVTTRYYNDVTWTPLETQPSRE